MQPHQAVSVTDTDHLTANSALENPLIFFKSLSDETRLGVLMLLAAEGELCVCELTEALDVSQPKISRHLALLRQQGMITDSRQGTWIYYRINDALPPWAHTILKTTLDNNQHLFSSHQQRLEKMGNRPERQSRCC